MAFWGQNKGYFDYTENTVQSQAVTHLFPNAGAQKTALCAVFITSLLLPSLASSLPSWNGYHLFPWSYD